MAYQRNEMDWKHDLGSISSDLLELNANSGYGEQWRHVGSMFHIFVVGVLLKIV